MRILQVVHGFPPADNGGAEIYADSVSRALVALGLILTIRLASLPRTMTIWILVATAGASGLLAVVSGTSTTETATGT